MSKDQDEDYEEYEDEIEYKERQHYRGFVMDGQRVKAITKLYAALQWFKKDFGERNQDSDKIRGFDLISSIKGDYIQNYTQSYKDEDSSIPNSRKDITKFNICWVVKVTFISVFGSEDIRYYYIVFRKTFFNRWANTYYENATKYFNHDGITLKVDVINHALPPHNDVISTSTLVLVTGDTKIYYISMEDVFDLASTKLGIFTDKWNQVCVGIPKSLMKEEDLNKFDY
jgi:hypothetical protein